MRSRGCSGHAGARGTPRGRELLALVTPPPPRRQRASGQRPESCRGAGGPAQWAAAHGRGHRPSERRPPRADQGPVCARGVRGRKDWGPAPADWGAAAADAAGHPRVSDAAASLSRARPRGESTSSDGRPRGSLSLPYPIGVSGSNRNNAFPEGRVRCRFPRLQAFAGSPSDPERHDGFC